MTASYLVLRDFPEPQVESVWREFLGSSEIPSHYCAPEFFREPFWSGKRPFAVLALDQGRVVGAATGIRDGPELLCGLPTRPQTCLVKGEGRKKSESSLAIGILREAESSKLVTVYSWTPLDALLEHGFRFRETEGAVMLDLSKGPEVLFREFSSDKRRNIRFSIKNGVNVQPATSREDLLEFYDLYLNWRSRKRINQPQISLETFEHALALTENRLVLIARHRGKVVATNSFHFYKGGLFESAANYSRSENLHLKPNELLQWRGIQWACRNRMQLHSLAGTHPFLRGFGKTVAPVYRYRLDRTWLRQYDLREAVVDLGTRLPKPLKQQIRRVLAKS
jgi:hypothetical protein